MPFDKDQALKKAEEIFQAAQLKQKQMEEKDRLKREESERVRQAQLRTMKEVFDPTFEAMSKFLKDRNFQDVSLSKSHSNQANPNASLCWRALGKSAVERKMNVITSTDYWAFSLDGGGAIKIPYHSSAEETEKTLWDGFNTMIC